MCICYFKDLSPDAWTAIGTIAMAVVTFITLFISKQQLEETRKQLKESSRPRINISIQIREGDFLLRIENTGLTAAHVTKLRFNDFFKEKLMVKQLRDRFIYLEESELVINARESKYFDFHPTMEHSMYHYYRTGEVYKQADVAEWLKLHSNDEIVVGCEYVEIGDNKKYSASMKTKLGNHYGLSRAICDTEVDALLKINNKLGEIENAVSVLSKTIASKKF